MVYLKLGDRPKPRPLSEILNELIDMVPSDFKNEMKARIDDKLGYHLENLLSTWNFDHITIVGVIVIVELIKNLGLGDHRKAFAEHYSGHPSSISLPLEWRRTTE